MRSRWLRWGATVAATVTLGIMTAAACGGGNDQGGADAQAGDGAPGDATLPALDGASEGGDAGATTDGGVTDASDAGDGASDGGLPPFDAGPFTYNDIVNPANWSFFDLATLPNAFALEGLIGAQFDGRYVYMISANGAASVRYDTTAAFGAQASWALFDTSGVTGGSIDYEGAGFDGKNLYFVPAAFGAGSVALRYDTTTPWGADGGFATFATSTLAGGTATGFRGVVFDGRYMYYVPEYNGAPDGVVARYDTTASFDAGASWTTFDVGTVNGLAKGFVGAVFDGRFVTFVPSSTTTTARYDTKGSFTAASSWSTFDLGTLDAGVKNFSGGAFDGQRIYFSPEGNSVATQYNAGAPFGAASSWTTFDMKTAVDGGQAFQFFYSEAAFDGRYVYFLPFESGRVMRYDATQPFDVASSWSTIDLTTLDTGVASYASAVFDGRYLYLVPTLSGGTMVVARFDAKSPSGMPPLPAFFGSFF